MEVKIKEGKKSVELIFEHNGWTLYSLWKPSLPWEISVIAKDGKFSLDKMKVDLKEITKIFNMAKNRFETIISNLERKY